MLEKEALCCGDKVQELRAMIEERANLVYEALRTRPNPYIEKYENLARLCAVKRTYEVPPEYSGILNIEKRIAWSPTDTEVARVLVSATIAEPLSSVAYSDLVSRLDSILPIARPHIYRSMKAILRVPPGRGGFVEGIRLR